MAMFMKVRSLLRCALFSVARSSTLRALLLSLLSGMRVGSSGKRPDKPRIQYRSATAAWCPTYTAPFPFFVLFLVLFLFFVGVHTS